MKTKLAPFLVRLLLGLNGLDAGLTLAAVIIGYGYELNPLMSFALRVGPLFFIFIKLAICEIAAVTMLEQYKDSDKIPWKLVFFNAIYILVVLSNLHLTMVRATHG